MVHLRCISICALVLISSACSTTYRPVAIDEKTGLYATSTSVPPGGIEPGDAAVNLRDFAAVLLVADSNRYPSRLELVARKALTDLGFRNVVNIPELRSWAEDRKFSFAAGKITLEALRDFSANVRPLLVVDLRYGWLGQSRHYAGLRVFDGRSGAALLTVNHPKMVWMNVDDEIIYPVLNELRKWHRSLAAKGT